VKQMTAFVRAAGLLAGLVAGPLYAQAGNGVGLPLGARPEAAVIEDLDGLPADLADYVGKGPVLIEFWATWCPVCAKLAPEMAAAHARFGGDVRFLVVAVAVNQSPRSVKRHMADHPVPYPVLWDAKGRATRAFQAPTTSYIVILDADGIVVYTGVGAEQDLTGALERILAREPS
jgi:thiol-disulfide isomerase/thioredoxin